MVNQVDRADIDALKKELQDSLTWEHKPSASLDQASPVQNTWYTVLDTTTNVKIYWITMKILATNEDLEIRITIDGTTMTGSQAGAVAGTTYFVFLNEANELAVTTTGYNAAKYAALEARSIKVEVRKTSANGSGNLQGEVVYAKRE